MHIRIYPLKPDGTATGAAPVLVTGELPEEYPLDGLLRAARQSELVPLVEAGEVEPLSQGNDERRLEFSLRRTWPTAGTANLHWLDHIDEVPPFGRVELIVVEPNGAQVGKRSFTKANITVAQGTFKGRATTFQYVIEGGRLKKN